MEMRQLRLIANVIGIIVVGCITRNAEAADAAIGATTINATVININTPTQITVTAAISDPKVISSSVNLIRLNAVNSVVSTIGVLHDDGLNGDDYAGDRVFSIRFTLNEAEAGEIRFRVSAAFSGLPARMQANVKSLFVQAPNALSKTLADLADDLEKEDIQSAARKFAPLPRNIDTLAGLSEQERKQVASGLRNATCKPINADVETCTFSWVREDNTIPFQFMVNSVAGQWIINSW